MTDTMPQPPADVEDQTAQIVQSGIAELLYPGVEVDGALDDLLLWAGFQQEACCVILCAYARRRDGGVGRGAVQQSALYVARNRVGNAEDSGVALSLSQLQLLEQLALSSAEQSASLEVQAMRNDWLRRRA